MKQLSHSKGSVKSDLQSNILYVCLNHTFFIPKQSRIILNVLCMCTYTNIFFLNYPGNRNGNLKKYEVI